MSKYTDQQYLKAEQYKDASNLNARILLHERFSENKQGWASWVFDTYEKLPASAKVLELGSGSAFIWTQCPERISAGWDITLSDLSPGMLATAQENLAGVQHQFNYREIDAQSIPFGDETFDIVIANHMLYHVPDREKGIAEVRRVLKPGGYFYAATNGEPHLRELFEWMKKIAPDCLGKDPPSTRGFALENGAEQLSRSFAEVEMDRYEEDLKVTEAEPFVAYVASTDRLNDDQLATLAEQVAAKIERCGTIHITKSQGLFISF